MERGISRRKPAKKHRRICAEIVREFCDTEGTTPMITTATILDLLRQHPSGLHVDEACALLGSPKTNLSSRLSKLAAYGVIRATSNGVARRYLPLLARSEASA